MNNTDLDACIAGIMGYEDMGRHTVTYQNEKVRQWKVRVRRSGPHPFHYVEFKPSTVLVDAWKLVAKMARLDNPWMMTLMNWNYNGERYFTAMFRDSSLVNVEVQAQAAEAPRAICLAALKALGVKVVS